MKGLFFIAGLLIMLITVSMALAEPVNTTGNNPPGIPQRIELVEKVLEVEKLTKQPTLDLKGTDYQPGDDGKILAYVLEGQQPVTNAMCLVSVLYPNHSIFIDNALMFEINNTAFAGLYYYNFDVPNTTGVYPVTAYCIYGTTKIYDSPDEETGNLTEAIESEGINSLSPSVEGSQEFESSPNCNIAGGGVATCNWFWNITLPSGAITEFLDDFRLIIRTHTDASEIFYYNVYNYNTSIWENILNISNGNPVEPTTFQFVISEDYVSLNNDVSVMVMVQDFDNPQNLEVYDLYTSRTYNATFIQDMRGSNEIVVSSALYNQTINLGDLLEAKIDVLPGEQQGEIFVIIIFFILLLTGFYSWASITGLFYSFIYLEGLFTLVGAGICAYLLYWSNKQQKKK